MAQLLSLPPELLLSILENVDIPDLLSLTKTCHYLRTTSTDPLLHRHRLIAAKSHLAHALPSRPPHPPPPPLFLTPQQATQRMLARKLTKISLKRKLQTRLDLPTLVQRGVIPAEASVVAPALVSRAQELEKERVKDAVRGMVGRRRSLEKVAEREGWDGIRPASQEKEGGRHKVRDLARRYGRWGEEGGGRKRETRWGSGRCVKWDPPRAKVLGLKRFYEMLTKVAIG